MMHHYDKRSISARGATKLVADSWIATRHFPRVLSSSDLLRRLRDHRDAGGTNNAAIQKLLNLPSSRVSEIFNGTRKIKADEAKRLIEHFKFDAGAASDEAPTRNASAGETVSITALDLSLSMGLGTPIEEFVESEPVEFDLGILRSLTRSPFARLRLLRGIGTSMEPKFQAGDRFIIDTTERALSKIDGYYWITLHGAHGLKRLRPAGKQKIQVISEAADFDPITVDADELTIEGRAIWFSREL